MEKYFFSVILAVLCAFFGVIFVINFTFDPYGLKSLDSTYARFLVSEAQELYPKRIYAKAPNYLVGSSRTAWLNLYTLQNHLQGHIVRVGLSGSNIADSIFLTHKIKENGARVVLGLDGLNTRHKGHTSRLAKHFDENKVLYFIRFYFNIFIAKDALHSLILNALNFPKDLKYTKIKSLTQHIDIKMVEKDFFLPEPHKRKAYENYEINYENIEELASLLDSRDIVIVFPLYFAYYKMFQKYGIEEKFFGALKILRERTDAQIWSFYGINELTLEAQNFSDDGFHFRAFAGDKMIAQIFEGQDFGGVQLTKENIDETLARLSREVRQYGN